MLQDIIEAVEQECKPYFAKVDRIVEINQRKVLNAFKNKQIGDHHFRATDGYGYDDQGRDCLEAVYAEVFGGEDALVRPQIVSGTHAIATALFGILRPGDELLYITGSPYDTLEEIVGKRGHTSGSMKEFGILYNEVPLLTDGNVDFAAVKQAFSEKTKIIGIQRSKGYENRPSFSIAKIQEMIAFVKKLNPQVIVFVDNCYGEFVEEKEPLEVGADIIAGSLIKNPGGGLVRAGGYIVGRKELIEQAANRLTAPGLGKEAGATLQMLQEMYQGFFLAPHVVGEALKGAIFTARMMERFAIPTAPAYDAERTDIIQSIIFEDKAKMITFCEQIQANSPINSYVTPYPSEMPGYDDKVIMAAGTFIQGSSIELSVDGPIKPPYIAFMQGGLTYAHVKIAIAETLQTFLDKGYISLT